MEEKNIILQNIISTEAFHGYIETRAYPDIIRLCLAFPRKCKNLPDHIKELILKRRAEFYEFLVHLTPEQADDYCARRPEVCRIKAVRQILGVPIWNYWYDERIMRHYLTLGDLRKMKVGDEMTVIDEDQYHIDMELTLSQGVLLQDDGYVFHKILHQDLTHLLTRTRWDEFVITVQGEPDDVTIDIFIDNHIRNLYQVPNDFESGELQDGMVGFLSYIGPGEEHLLVNSPIFPLKDLPDTTLIMFRGSYLLNVNDDSLPWVKTTWPRPEGFEYIENVVWKEKGK
jgi:hypothetical protein